MITHNALTAALDDAGSPATPTGPRGSTLGGTPGPHGATVQQATQAPAARDSRRWVLSPVMIAFVSANAALLGMALFVLVSCGSVDKAIGYYLRGETLLLDATEKSFGVAAPSGDVGVSFRFTNWGDEPIRILGCKTVCNCTIPRDLPYTMAPGESRDLNLTVMTAPFRQVRNGRSSHINLPLTVFTSSRAQSRLGLIVRGEVREKPVAGN